MNTKKSPICTSLASAAAFGLCMSCISAPTPEELLATGFRSPSQAFGTLQTAIAGDHIDMGYRCFTDSFKASNGMDNMVWQAAWTQMLQKTPSMRHLSEAEIVDKRELAPNRVELIVELDSMFVNVRARVILVREDFFEAYRGEEVYFDGFRSFDDFLFVQEETPSDLVTFITVPEGKAKDEITEIRIGQDWHIDSFEVLDETTASHSTP
jgi:hypothetical protein